MRNLLNFRRIAERPSLKERAADLKAGLARLTGRSEPEATRRAVVVGSLAAAVPLPALAMPAPEAEAGPHLDQALLDAEAELLRASAAAKAIGEARAAAADAMHNALGPFPADLLMTPWEQHRFAAFYSSHGVLRLRTHRVHHEDRLNPDFGWTAEALRRVIEVAPSIFGKAGQTPHRIRRWRGLLPAAETYDARHDALQEHHRIRDLRAESDAAEKAVRRARARLHRIPATTVEGLAVHTRLLASTAWHESNTTYTALLLSAAAITGVKLRQSDFDVPAWIAAWEQVGGKVEWWPTTEEWAFICPPLAGASEEVREQVRNLSYEKSSHSAVIDRWLDDHTSDPRFARA